MSICVIRYLEESHGTTTPNGQDGGDTKYNDQEEELPGIYSHLTTGTRRTSDAWELQPASRVLARARSSGRTTDTDRTTDTLEPSDDRAPADDRHHHHRTKTLEVWRPPDDRHPRHPTLARNLTPTIPSQTVGIPTSTGRLDPREPPDDQ